MDATVKPETQAENDAREYAMHLDNEARLAWFDTHIRELQERVAFAELARDNAVTLRDEVDRRRKQSGESAGKRIAALTQLVRAYAKLVTTNTGNTIGTDVEEKLAEILR